MNIDKINGFSPIRPDYQSDVKNTGLESSKAADANKAVSEDKLEFSNRASEVGRLVEIVKELPDIRAEKVNSLRGEIAAGRYKPAADDIAGAILKDETA